MCSSGKRLQHQMPLGIVCLVLLVGGNAYAADVCRTGCKSRNAQTFKYAMEKTYEYSYNGKIDISLSSAEGQVSSTKVKADVLLTQLPHCDQLLSLKNVYVLNGNGEQLGTIPDIKKPIRINNNGGVLEDSICIVDGDNQNSINIKRAIASMFQVSMKTGYETDVFGRCPTEFSTRQEGDVLIVHKSRNLNRCSYREHIRKDFLSVTWNLDSEIKSSPLLNGDYSADLRIKDGIIYEATVTENYLYVPFSVGKNGAKAKVVSELRLKGRFWNQPEDPVTKPRSIIFENPRRVVPSTNNTQTLLDAIKESAQTIDVVVGETTAREFTNLLKIFRSSGTTDLVAAYNQITIDLEFENKDVAMRLYSDALHRCRTGECFGAIMIIDIKAHSEKYQGNEMEMRADYIKNLVYEDFLMFGRLVRLFCEQYGCNSIAVDILTDMLIGLVEDGKHILFALKSLANFHCLTINAITKLTALAQNKTLPNSIRVVALETYLSDACKDSLRDSALQILQDLQEDSEIRIKAYLALAQCPNDRIGNAIKTLLAEEPSIQVGGFISSHIRTLHSSTNQDKALAKQFLGFNVGKSFPIDPRKYSFNGEFSYAVDTFGLGASSEANVIYSQNSWLPRSISLNLTADIFGHSFNFFEIGTRQENLDKLVEQYFGPKKYTEQEQDQTLRRRKRDVNKAEIDSFAEQIQFKANDKLHLDVSLKAFGHDVYYRNISDIIENPSDYYNFYEKSAYKVLYMLQEFNETLRYNTDFLDAELDYPTSLGFPLRLAVEGSANIQVKGEGEVDVPQLFLSPEKGELKVKLVSSANIQVSGRLTLDALVVENGLKVVSTIYSSTAGDLTAMWDRDIGFRVKFGLPEQEQKLVSVNHEIVLVTRPQAGPERNLPLKFAQPRKDFSTCYDRLRPSIGLIFCGKFSGSNLGSGKIPILPFSLAGNAKLDITIENHDFSSLKIEHVVKKTYTDLILIIFNKNSRNNVGFHLQLEGSPQKYIRVSFRYPGVAVVAEAKIIATDVEKYLLVEVINKQDEFFSGKIGVSISGTPETTVYQPILELRMPTRQQPWPVRTEGQLVVESDGGNVQYTLEGIKIIYSDKFLGVHGDLGRDAGEFYANLVFFDGVREIEFQGEVQPTPELSKFKVNLYTYPYKHVNFELKGEFKRHPFEYDVLMQISHQDLKHKRHYLTATSSLFNEHSIFKTKNSISYPLFGVSGKFELAHTPNALDYEVKAEYGKLKLGSVLESKFNEKTSGDYEIKFEIDGLDNKLKLKSKRQVLPHDKSEISNSAELNGVKVDVEGFVRHDIRPQYINIGTELTAHAPTQSAPIKISTGLKLFQKEIDAYSKISSESDVIIDFFLKRNEKVDANGRLKVNLKNSLSVNCEIHANNGTGTVETLIDIQNGRRQIKSDTNFNVQPRSAYDITATIYPSFHKDKNQKIFLRTLNRVSRTSLDSKNKIELLGHSLEVNAKSSKTGDQQNGKLDGEVEVILPGQQYFLAKRNYDHQEQNDFTTGQQQGTIEYRKNKNAPGYKYGYKGTLRNTNFADGIIDADLSLFAEDSNGKTINADLTLKSFRQGDVAQLNFTNKLYGSLLSNRLDVNLLTLCYKGMEFRHELRNRFDHDFIGEGKGGNFNLQVTSTSERLRSLNVDLSGSLIQSKLSGRLYNLDGLVRVLAENAQGLIIDLNTNTTIDQEKGSTNAVVNYGPEKTVSYDISFERVSELQYKLVAFLQTPVEGYENTVLTVHTKRSDDGSDVTSSVEFVVDGRTYYKANTELVLTELTPTLDVKLVGPEGKLHQFRAKANKFSSRHFNGELKLISESGRSFHFESFILVNIENVDNITIRGKIDSYNLNLHQIIFDAHHMKTYKNHNLQVIIKTAGTPYLAGIMRYAAKEKNGKFIIDGGGIFQVKGKSKSARFNYTTEKLELDKNGEQGIHIWFDAALGDRNIDSEYKSTNKHFRMLTSYREQKKEYAYIEVDNKINSNDVESFNQIVKIKLCLHKLGLSHEFGLEAVTNRNELASNHTIDAHFQNRDNGKYQFNVFVHPSDVEISLTTPKRIISLETRSNFPDNFGKGTGEIVFYIDKKYHPSEKTVLAWSLDVDLKGSVNGEAKLNHPGLKRPLVASIKTNRDSTPFNFTLDIAGELDIFVDESQKLVATYHKSQSINRHDAEEVDRILFTLKSDGLGIDILASKAIHSDPIKKEFNYESKVKYQAGKSKLESVIASKLSPNEVSGIVKVLNKVLLKGFNKIQVGDNEQVIESESSSYDNNLIVSRLEIKNYSTVAYSLGPKNQADKRILFNAGFIPGQIADIRADHQDGGNKINLFFATVKLDDANFLKSEHKVDSKAIHGLLGDLKERSSTYLSGLEAISKEFADEAKQEVQGLGELAKKAAPNLQLLIQYYSKELQEVKEEILNDESIRELNNVLESLINSEIVKKISQPAEEFAIILENFFFYVIRSLQDQLIPSLKQIGSVLIRSVRDAVEIAQDISLTILANAARELEEFQPALQELSAIFGEVFQNFGRLIYRAYENSSENIKNLTKWFIYKLLRTPDTDEYDDQYQQLVNERKEIYSLYTIIKEAVKDIKHLIPPDLLIKDDICNLLDKAVFYFERKLQNQLVDDQTVFLQIGEIIANIIVKMMNIAGIERIKVPAISVDLNNLISFSNLKNLPRLVPPKFSHSVLNQSPKETAKFLSSLVDSPDKVLPPFALFGMIVQGQHIFTFDGKHITLPGKCSYLFARDAANGNFTLAGSYNDGVLASITLASESGSITLLQGGTIKANQDLVELPYREPNLAAWRDYEMITLFSTTGPLVHCTPDLARCSIRISGFYHGQLRGLLGNGNNEPYDDFIIPKGQIVSDEEQFGNAYKLTSSCPDITVPRNDFVPANATCSKLFSFNSSLRHCYPFVSTKNFKAACNHGLAANVEGTELEIAKAYAAACQERNIPIHLPENLVQCTNSEKPFNVGDKFSVKLPSKAADIVLVVDSAKANQQLYDKLVKTLVPELTTELQNKGVRDIEYHLIAYGGENQWPSHVTVNGKLTFKGKPPALKFGEEPKHEFDIKDIENPTLRHYTEELKTILHDLHLAIGSNLKARTFDEATKYPFRVDALKSIVVVNGKKCELGRFYPLQKLFANFYTNSQISLNLFTPFTTLTTKDSKKSKDIVGFNGQNVFTLSQGKKNPKGSSELHKELNYDDYCVDFTIKNRGNAFVNNNFLALNDVDQKQFVRLAATNIADQLLNFEQGLDCECKLNNPWHANNVCTEAFSRNRPSETI